MCMPVTKKFYKAKFCGKELQRLFYRTLQMSRSYTYLILWEGVTTPDLHVSIYRDEKYGTQLQTRFYRINLYGFQLQCYFYTPKKQGFYLQAVFLNARICVATVTFDPTFLVFYVNIYLFLNAYSNAVITTFANFPSKWRSVSTQL